MLVSSQYMLVSWNTFISITFDWDFKTSCNYQCAYVCSLVVFDIFLPRKSHALNYNLMSWWIHFCFREPEPSGTFFRKLQLQNWILDKALSKYLRTRVNFMIGGRILEKLFLSKIISWFENFFFRMDY